MADIDSQVTNIKQMIFRDIESAQNIIFPGLLDTVPAARIPESIFVNYFLPGFLGTPVNSKWVLDWISVAGSPMSEVAVVSDTSQEILFVVPGILYTNNLLIEKHDGDLGDIFTRYEQLSMNGQGNGFSFLVSALHSKNDIMLSNNSLKAVNDKWAIILQRYGHLIPDTDLKVVEEDSLNDAFEY